MDIIQLTFVSFFSGKVGRVWNVNFLAHVVGFNEDISQF